MSNWYQGKIRYQQQDEKGRNKTINETYLVDAVSYTDAEARMYKAIASNIPDFHLSKLARMKLAEVFFIDEGSEIWYKAKVQYIAFDEKTQKEKKIPYNMLINADNPLEAYNLLKERLGSVQDYQITDLNITNILEVIPYDEKEEKLKHGNFKPLAEVLASQEAE
ncbi:MAG: DUF4494 domain-containing protein [Spirosomaceae bacterium]|jgi:hypothetical protein|nr:DUF4494 domain-containing protein [Spirosomataceae bacterium]